MRVLSMPVAALLLAVAGPPAPAAGADLYAVGSISVDRSAESAAAAKAAAMADARAIAMQTVLRRLTLEADHARLPTPEPEALEAAMRAVQVLEEQSSRGRYLARVSVGFHSEPVRALLRAAGIPFSEAVSEPVAVFPVYEWGRLRLLFEEASPWRNAWAALPPANDPVPLFLPAIRPDDPTAPTPAEAEAGDADRLLAIAGRMGARRALVAHAVYRRAAAGPALDIRLRRFGPGAPAATDSFGVEARAGETLEALGARAALLAAARVQESWKRANLVAVGSPPEPFEAEAALDGLTGLLALGRALRAAGGVEAVRLVELRRSRAVFRFRFAGGAERLAGALRRQGVGLERAGGGWALGLLGR